MKKVFLDTNIFLRFLVEAKGKQFRECVRLFELVESGQIKGVICSVVVLEIYFTLRSFYGFSFEKCGQILSRVLKLKNLKIRDDFDYSQALDLFLETKIKFADCLIASLGFLKKGGWLVSYDKDFDKLGVKRIEPREI